jgi:hypothetical protein
VVLGGGTGESLNAVPSAGLTWPEFKERLVVLPFVQENAPQELLFAEI